MFLTNWQRRLRRNSFYRNTRVALLDTLVLLREFWLALLLFVTAITGSALLFHYLLGYAGYPARSLAESAYAVLAMMVFEVGDFFPAEWYLQLFYFVMPIVGLAIIGLGVADFGALLFNRKQRGEAWQVAIASLYSGHVVLVGIGHVGLKVVRELHNLGEEVVVIERNAGSEKRAAMEAMRFPIIAGDAVRSEVLTKAGVQKAAALVLCTSNDSANLQIALKARGMNPKLRIVVRVFDEEFAAALQGNMAIDQAFSSSALAAPAIAASALEADITPPVTLAGRVLSMGQYVIRARSKLAGMAVGDVERDYDVSVVLLEKDGVIDLHPPDEVCLAAGDRVAIFADRTTLSRITRDHRR